MNGRKIRAVFIFSSYSILSILLSCAEIAPPPGGEEDRTSPSILRATPANGSLNVEQGREITFWFSEGITRPSTAKPVFISPRPDRPPELQWKSDRLIIKLAEPFDSNQTYVVTLTSEIADWRRNRMDSTFTIAFSTGDKIDSGSISGYILKQGKPKSGVLVGLYDQFETADPIQFDSVYPNYIIPSAADGSFKFKFLPKKKFIMIAFEDINRNERFNPAEEPFALPDREIDFVSTLPLNELYLELSQPAVKEPAIVSVVITLDGLVKIRFNTAIDLSYLKSSPSGISIISKIDSTRVQSANAFLESYLDTSSIITAYAGKIDTGNYSVKVLLDPQTPVLTFDNLVVAEIKDKTPPAIVKFIPEEGIYFKDKISLKIVFSEPIDTTKLTDGTYVLTDESNQAMPLQPDWLNSFQTAFQSNALQEGRKYTMKVAEFEIADLAQNLLGDSIRTFSFSVINSDSLGSASGTIKVEIPNRQTSVRHLSFRHISGKPDYEFPIERDSFNVSLPAGKYLMSCFLDENNNGKRDPGVIWPYAPAETFARSTDTVTVRARFETAGIEFNFK